MYCPICGSTSVESEEEAMAGVWMYHRHYCQDCGCSLKVLRVSAIKSSISHKGTNRMKEEKEWWEYLDWSEMGRTFKRLPESMKKKILERAYWSCGKGKFAPNRR
jgi:hypothetical protein